MWSGITAAAKEAAEDGLSGLERLKRNLQSAAALCQPAGAVAAVYENERETRRASRPPTRPPACGADGPLRGSVTMRLHCAARLLRGQFRLGGPRGGGP